jgi:hypothetical protein
MKRNAFTGSEALHAHVVVALANAVFRTLMASAAKKNWISQACLAKYL